MQKVNKIQILRRSLIFSGLNDEELAELAKMTVERSFAPGESIFWEGDAPNWFYIICEGKIKVLKHSSTGKDFIIAFFSTGEMFGEVAVFENRPYPASAQAAVETKALALGSQKFLSFLTIHPTVALRIIGILGGRLRDAHNRLSDLASERVEQRLATILLMLASKFGSALPFTRKEIAEMSGTTTETAIRVLSRLKDGGIIRSARNKIIILDETKLKLLSEGPPQL